MYEYWTKSQYLLTSLGQDGKDTMQVFARQIQPLWAWPACIALRIYPLGFWGQEIARGLFTLLPNILGGLNNHQLTFVQAVKTLCLPI